MINNAVPLSKDLVRLKGFGNLFRQENKKWWGTRRWWTQCLAWVLIINGTLAINMILDDSQRDLVSDGFAMFIIYLFVFTSMGIAVWSQGVIIGEKQTGTAAWILSKPVSRSAFILSKGVAVYINGVLIMIVLQCLIAYLQISFAAGHLIAMTPFIWALFLAALHLLFYLALSVMLGTIFDNQGPVIGIMFTIIIGLELLDDYIAQVFPLLANTFPTTLRSVTPILALGKEAFSGEHLVPVLAMPVWAIVFIAIAIWRFEREEL